MNKSKQALSILSEISSQYHCVEILIRHLDKIIVEWNKGPEADKAIQISNLVDSVRWAERCRSELLHAGYQNVAYKLDHIGNLCGWAIKHDSKRKTIGGSLNLALREFEQNPQWLKVAA